MSLSRIIEPPRRSVRNRPPSPAGASAFPASLLPASESASAPLCTRARVPTRVGRRTAPRHPLRSYRGNTHVSVPDLCRFHARRPGAADGRPWSTPTDSSLLPGSALAVAAAAAAAPSPLAVSSTAIVLALARRRILRSFDQLF